MKIKKRQIISVFILIFLSFLIISTASAAQSEVIINNTDTNSVLSNNSNTLNPENNSNNLMCLSSNNVNQLNSKSNTVNLLSENTNVYYVNGSKSSGGDGKSWDTAFNSIKTSINTINGESSTDFTVYIANGTYTENNMEITKNISFIGNSSTESVIINGDNGQIFSTPLTNLVYNIKFTNLTLTNAKSTTVNGSVLNIKKNGNVEFNNCQIENNTVNSNTLLNISGGAIHIVNGNVTVTNSNFTNNTLNLTTDINKEIEVKGGAIFVGTGNINITKDSWFINNTINTNNSQSKNFANGGAIHIDEGNFTVTDSYFYYNLVKSNSSNNYTNIYGGALDINKGNITIINSIFQNNSLESISNNMNLSSLAYGGSINIGLGNVNITNSDISYNTVISINRGKIAGSQGGGLRVGQGNITVFKSKLNYNTLLSNTTGTSNCYGGAIYVLLGTVNITNNSCINYNSIYSETNVNSNSYGGGIYVLNGTVNVNHSSFINNTVKTNGTKLNALGSAIYVDLNSTSNINYSVFFNNTCFNTTYPFNAIFSEKVNADYNWWGNNTPDKSLILNGSSNEPVIFYPNNHIILNYTLNTTNILTTENINITLKFSTNTSEDLTSDLPSRPLIISNGHLTKPTVDINNNFKSVKFTDNVPNNYILNISVDNQVFTNPIVISKIYYINGSILNPGDGSAWNKALKNITNVSIREGSNFIVYIASGTYKEHNINLTKNMSFIGYNIADKIIINGEGNQIFNTTTESEVLLNFTNLTLINGKADSGGAINVKNGDLILNNTILINNTATNDGGAININGKFSASNSVFINNTATGKGNVINTSQIVNVNGNWWGNNTPNNSLISENSKNYNINDYIIMSININPPIISAGSSSTVNVEFKNQNGEHINNNLPTRQLTLTSTGGDINTNNLNISKIVSVTYTAGTTIGTYTITGKIDNQELNQTIKITEPVIPTLTFITGEDITSKVGNLNFTVSLKTIDGTSLGNESILYILYNDEYHPVNTDSNGLATITLNNLTLGTYNIRYVYFGNNLYSSSSGSNTINIVNNTKENSNLKTNYSNNVLNFNLTSNDKPLTNENITLNINGSKIILITDNEGLASIDLSNYAPGEYTIKYKYSGNEIVNGVNGTMKIIVINTDKVITILSLNNFTETYGEGLNLTGKLLNTQGQPIIGQHIALNLTRLSDGASKIYPVTTDINGEYQLAINLYAGEYTASANFYGNTIKNITYLASGPVNATISVTKSNTTLIANTFIEKEWVGQNFTGKLTDFKGNPIIGQYIALNLTRLDTKASKTYYVSTDTQGEYQLPINLEASNYTASCTYTGSNLYNQSNAFTTITVIK